MGNLDFKIRLKGKRLIVIAVLLTVIAIACAIFLSKDTRIAHLPDGSVVKLEDYSFRRGAVRYELPNRPIVRKLGNVLPDWMKTKIKWPRPRVSAVVTPPSVSEEEIKLRK